MILNKENLAAIKANTELSIPSPETLELPEKMLQFGTGVLLRGLPDYFIHKANQQGLFRGRIVVVKSTDKGGTAEFDDQDSLYTLCIRGIENGQKIEENIVCSAISRVLTAGKDWEDILAFAASPDLQVIISNTTEVGIQLVQDDMQANPPVSFPGKLMAVLFARYQAFRGDKTKGLVIVPTELIPDNGTKLKAIVTELAQQHQLEIGFMEWLNESNIFCNSLVDRIVPGKPDAETLATLEKELGYYDQLLTMSEVYRLWAIEGNEQVQQVLSFAAADSGVVITPDINKYRELKLRLLNGTHTLSCGVAFLSGFDTVKNAMDDSRMAEFISGLMQEDIAPAIPYPVDADSTSQFARQVLDRFRNPHIKHQWLSITLNYTTKLKMRVVPVLQKYYEEFNRVPDKIAFGFAAYLLFMKANEVEQGKYYGQLKKEKYIINDDKADYFYTAWQNNTADNLVLEVLKNKELWGTDLTALPGFTSAVQKQLKEISAIGVLSALNVLELEKISD